MAQDIDDAVEAELRMAITGAAQVASQVARSREALAHRDATTSRGRTAQVEAQLAAHRLKQDEQQPSARRLRLTEDERAAAVGWATANQGVDYWSAVTSRLDSEPELVAVLAADWDDAGNPKSPLRGRKLAQRSDELRTEASQQGELWRLQLRAHADQRLLDIERQHGQEAGIVTDDMIQAARIHAVMNQSASYYAGVVTRAGVDGRADIRQLMVDDWQTDVQGRDLLALSVNTDADLDAAKVQEREGEHQSRLARMPADELQQHTDAADLRAAGPDVTEHPAALDRVMVTRDPRWWDRATPEEIGRTYQTALTYRAHDEQVAEIEAQMREEFRSRYHLDLGPRAPALLSALQAGAEIRRTADQHSEEHEFQEELATAQSAEAEANAARQVQHAAERRAESEVPGSPAAARNAAQAGHEAATADRAQQVSQLAYDSAERREAMAAEMTNAGVEAEVVDDRIVADKAQGRPATAAISRRRRGPRARKTRLGTDRSNEIRR